MNTIISWLSQNFVPAWKAASILFTGAFGILGLVKNFKEKRRDEYNDVTVDKITVWGWISLVGIIVSTGCGMVVQLKESHDDARKSLELSRRSEDSLREIKKILSPIDISNVHLIFRAACVGVYEAMCASEQAFPTPMAYESLDIWVQIYPNDVDLGDPRYSNITNGFGSSIHFAITSQHHPSEGDVGPLAMTRPFGEIRDATVIAGGTPMVYKTDGKIRSIDDLQGAVAVVRNIYSQPSAGDGAGITSMYEMRLQMKNGRVIEIMNATPCPLYGGLKGFRATININDPGPTFRSSVSSAAPTPAPRDPAKE
jgi:hypothetical protein